MAVRTVRAEVATPCDDAMGFVDDNTIEMATGVQLR